MGVWLFPCQIVIGTPSEVSGSSSSSLIGFPSLSSCNQLSSKVRATFR